VSTLLWGTPYAIRSYPDDTVQHVAVVTGKVKVATLDGFSETLVPDEMTIYKNNEMIRKSGFNHEAVLGWKDGVLQFNNTDFAGVTDQLAVWYGVDFIIDDDLIIEGRYTGVYRNESLENVLKGISFSSDFEFIIDDNIVRITKPQIK
jgi:ferric-dicitrate binding protein FerR (iron transport regulator)